MADEEQIIETHEALVEMYKAGFLDGYKIKGKARSKKDFLVLNKFYKQAFFKRFQKQITKELKSTEKKNVGK